jgi:hypothetical protein
VLALGVTLVASAAFAKRSSNGGLFNYDPAVQTTKPTWDNSMSTEGLNASAAQGTTVLYTQRFEVGASCNEGTWTKVDLTAQLGNFFHVDNFSGLNPVNYYPLNGTQSLWCGARPASVGPLCGYLGLPGYGNSWNQAFCTTACFAVSADSLLDMKFLARFYSEPGYDATSLEVTTDCSGLTGWTTLDGGTGGWDGIQPLVAVDSAYAVGSTGPVKVRIHFQSDTAWSDEDNLFASSGAVYIDDLSYEGGAVEDFEGEAPGATSATGWTTCTPAGYGMYTALYPGSSSDILQEDPCARDLLCLWAPISGSTYNYACGGFPLKKAMPYVNADGQYLTNELWSPDIANTGSGSTFVLEFSAYRDNPLDNLQFYVWHVRSKAGVATCPTGWADRNFVYYGGQKDWLRQIQSVGDLLVHTGAGTYTNLALGIYDMCGAWCGLYGTGACHSGAPLVDNVKFMRVDVAGAQWSVRDIDQFNDNFTDQVDNSGTARADMANDVLPGTNLGILPGDTAVVKVADPVAGLALEANSRANVKIYVSVQPYGQSTKTGAGLSGDLGRFPYLGTWTDANSVEWSIIQLDSSIVNGIAAPDFYCVDLNDALFEAGDTINFFYGAVNTNALETYCYGSALGASGSVRQDAADAPSEFTILPAGGFNRGGDILYVDGMDGRGAQPFFDTAFQSLGLTDLIDRFDVRGPSSGVSNRPAGRLKDTDQLLAAYKKILWDTGDLDVGLGDGTATPEKTDDWNTINEFLDGLTVNGGVYIAGDDAAFSLNTLVGSAITFRTSWLTHTLTSPNARAYGSGISPTGLSQGGIYTSDPSFVIHGGCPLINDFDVLEPTGAAVAEVTYNAAIVNGGTGNIANGAVLSQANVNGNLAAANVVFGGFSFIYIRDNDADGISDRSDFLYDTILFLNNFPDAPTPVGSSKSNSLSQNYPNPFNPQTTIAFAIKDRSHVTLRVYNVAGQLVRTLANESFDSGPHQKVWDGRNDAGQPVSSGVYFYKLVSNNFSQTKKMVLLK